MMRCQVSRHWTEKGPVRSAQFGFYLVVGNGKPQEDFRNRVIMVKCVSQADALQMGMNAGGRTRRPKHGVLRAARVLSQHQTLALLPATPAAPLDTRGPAELDVTRVRSGTNVKMCTLYDCYLCIHAHFRGK